MAKKYQKGQVLMIVVLVLVVALTVGLAIAARIVTELKLSKQNEESQRAFQAAEAGIQQTFLKQSPISEQNLGNNSRYETIYEASPQTSILVNNGLPVDQGVGVDVWMSKYSSDPSEIYTEQMGTGDVAITMFWGSQGQSSCNPLAGSGSAPAIELVVLKGPKNNPSLERFVFDNCGRIAPNSFSVQSALSDSPIQGTKYLFKSVITVNNALLMRVIPIYNSTTVAFSSSLTFKPQGSVVKSTGRSGDTVRKIESYKSFPQIPLEVFPYAIISQ